MEDGNGIEQQSTNKDNQQLTDRERFAKFYSSSQWKRLRNNKINNSPLCEYCLAKGLTVAAYAIDHIIPLAVDYSLRLDYNNLQSLCTPCHSKKTTTEDRVLKATGISITDTMIELENFDNE